MIEGLDQSRRSDRPRQERAATTADGGQSRHHIGIVADKRRWTGEPILGEQAVESLQGSIYVLRLDIIDQDRGGIELERAARHTLRISRAANDVARPGEKFVIIF